MQLETAQIAALPMQQKLQLLEIISDALFQEGERYQSPQWHADILDARKNELENRDVWLTLEQSRKMLRR